jgi:hypothetical protein
MRRGAYAVVLVALILASSIAAVGPVAGSAQTVTDAAGSDALGMTAVADRQQSVTTGQYSSHDSIVVTQEYRLTPDQPGRIDIKWHFRIPDRVSDIQTQLPPDATNVRTSRFSRTDDRIYEWSGDTTTATITFTREVNETTDKVGPEASDGRLKFVDAGDWAVIRRQPVTSPGYRYPRGQDPGVTLRSAVAGDGVVGDGLVYLGPHETHERTAHGQQFRLVLPDAANLATDRGEIFESVSDASDRLRVGDRDDSVLMIAAPTSVSWGVLGLQTGSSDFYVLADERVDTPDNTWVHEYVHTRQDLDTSDGVRWFYEGSAEYYAALLTLEQDRIGYDAFRDQLERGTWRQFSDVRLADPSTWRATGANYYTGALVAGDIDRRIRLATDGKATLQNAFRRMNREESSVTHSQFLEYVGDTSSESVTDSARRYTETTTRPDLWDATSQSEAFGTLPPVFGYEFPDRDSDALRVSSSYRSGPLGNGSLVPGETVALDVTVTNVGGTAGDYEFDFSVDGSAVATRSGRLDPGASTTQTVEYTVSEPGSYRLTAGEDSVTLRVEEFVTPVVRGLSASRERVLPGEDVTITATVANPADRPGQRQLTITRDGEEVESAQVRLGPGGSTEVSATVSLPESGTYRFEAGDRSVSVTVSERATATASGNGETERATGTSASGPGFGPGVAVLAVATLLLLKRVQ